MTSSSAPFGQPNSGDSGENLLDLAPEAFRELGHQAVDMAADYLGAIQNQRVFTPMTLAQRSEYRDASLPVAGESAETIVSQAIDGLFRFPMGNAHPRFFGWINSPPAPIGAIADFLAAITGPSCAGGDHAAIYIEHAVVRWLQELMGFAINGSAGLLVSGGSMASLTCLAAAREWAARMDGWSVRDSGVGTQRPLALYVSRECHSSVRKAAQLLGIGDSNVRLVPADEEWRLDTEALESSIDKDIAAGFRPFCVVASAGTTATGAVDQFTSIAEICERESLWFHVDGAYGAIGIVDPDVSVQYQGMDRADSLAFDPHKWLSVPVECGCAMIRDGELLRRTFSLVPAYIRTETEKGFGGPPWFSEFGFQQTRGFRALKLWMVLRQLGRDGIRDHVVRCNRLARRLAELVKFEPELELVAPANLSIVCFRFRPVDWSGTESELSELNRSIMYDVQERGEVFVTNAELDERLVLRACIVNFRTNESDLDMLVGAVKESGERLSRP